MSTWRLATYCLWLGATSTCSPEASQVRFTGEIACMFGSFFNAIFCTRIHFQRAVDWTNEDAIDGCEDVDYDDYDDGDEVVVIVSLRMLVSFV